MRSLLSALIMVAAFTGGAFAQEDKKTDDLKPADPDTGESTVEEGTLGLLPNPFEKQGVKFAITCIGEGLGNATGGAKQGAAYEDRINFAADVDFEKLIGLKQLTFHANVFQIDGGGLSRGRASELSGRERHRSAADDPALRNRVRTEMGNQGRLASGAIGRRHRIHDRQVHRRLHQFVLGLARRFCFEHAERRASPPLAAWERGCGQISRTI